MKTYQFVLSLSTLATVIGSVGGTAYASAVQPSSGGQQSVWVAKDVTKQDGYKLVYRTYDAKGKVISTRTVIPPAGSLVEFKKETLAQAKNQGLPYIIATNTSNLRQQLSQLHRDLFNKLNPQLKHSTISTNAAISPMTTSGMQGLTGQFTAYNATINYNVNWYDDPTDNNMSLQSFDTWQSSGPGHAWENEIDLGTSYPYYSYNWNGNEPEITSSKSAVSWSGSTTAPKGHKFATYVTGSNFWGTTYEGYATLN